MQRESQDGIANLNFDLKSLHRNAPRSRRQETSLLPGKSKQTICALKEDVIDKGQNWKITYSIHPDQNFATEGEIPFDQIEIRSRKPAPVPDGIT